MNHSPSKHLMEDDQTETHTPISRLHMGILAAIASATLLHGLLGTG